MMINHWLKCAPALQHNETHWLLLIILSSFEDPTTVDSIATIMGRTTRHVWNQLEPLIEAEFVERIAGTGRSCNGRRHRKAHFQLSPKAQALLSLNTEGLA
jgi:predicted transcriptional regulator